MKKFKQALFLTVFSTHQTLDRQPTIKDMIFATDGDICKLLNLYLFFCFYVY